MKKMFCALLVAPMIVFNSYAIEQEKSLPKKPLQVTIKNRKNQNVIRMLDYKVWHKIPLFRDNYCSFNNDLTINLSTTSSGISIYSEELDAVKEYLENNFCYKSSYEQLDSLYEVVRKLGLFDEYTKKDTYYTSKVVSFGNDLPAKKNKKTVISNISVIQMLANSSMAQYIFLIVSCATIQVTASGLFFAEA